KRRAREDTRGRLYCLARPANTPHTGTSDKSLPGPTPPKLQPRGAVRFKVWDASYDASVKTLRDAMGEKDFDAAWAEGAAMSTEQAIAYAERGRGERKRPTSGWASLTSPSATSSGSSAKDSATRTSPQGFSSHRAPYKPT